MYFPCDNGNNIQKERGIKEGKKISQSLIQLAMQKRNFSRMVKQRKPILGDKNKSPFQ